MSHANTRWLHDDRTWYADIPGLNGVWATGISERACREELRTVLEEWLALGLRLGHPIPEIDGVTVTAGTRE